LRQTVADRPEAGVRNAARFLDKVDLNLMKILGIAPMWQTKCASTASADTVLAEQAGMVTTSVTKAAVRDPSRRQKLKFHHDRQMATRSGAERRRKGCSGFASAQP
jgi:hypothetical protein